MSPPTRPTTADELRQAFTSYFVARDHTLVPSASVIPHDKTVLFTVAGMVPFKPYFTGEETPPFKRAVSVQKCIRAGGKHNDLEEVGRTNRHLCFFEMLGNFSFGDYFKVDAIPWAYSFVTEVLGIDPDRLWVTVHVDDDEAESIWRDDVGFPPERTQRLDEDNFWRMGETGPCGPSSEIFFDLGPDNGPEGGPATGHDRYVEIWNLVFMQFDQQADGTRPALPRPCIDTGAGLDRILAVMQGKDSVWETDIFTRLIAAASDVTGVTSGESDRTDVSLRILAEHGRAMTFMVSDGVVPSNEERGYVLRRIIRRAVRHAYLLGAHDLVTPALVDATIEVMGNAYPQLVNDRDLVVSTVRREEERFRSTLARGLEMLDEIVARGDVGGADAFFLHDTLGFPIDLTVEIAAERGRSVDLDGFRSQMERQRERARQAHKEAGGAAGTPVELYREVLDEHGATEFTGRQEYSSRATVLALVVDGERVAHASEGDEVDVILDRSPFYAEAGGQVGDTGELRTDAGARLDVRDTKYGLPGVLTVHQCVVVNGTVNAGDGVAATIDGVRRDRIRRNHTATHLLHYALRQVLGSHVQQKGSLVAPDRLRFDFSHFEAVTPEQLAQVEEIANSEVISDAPVRHYETTMAEAQALGAIAFFGDKYGDVVRVLEAGEHSVELCGGTHVHALGFIGPIKIVSEGSIGSNLRRIEALTGDGALDYIHDEEATLRKIGTLLRATPKEVPEKVERLVEQMKALDNEIKRLKAREAASVAKELASEADGGIVAARRNGLTPDELRRLAQETLRVLTSGVVAVLGETPDGKAGIAIAVSKDLQDAGASAAELGRPAASTLGGGGGKNPDVFIGSGPRADAIDEAMQIVRERAVVWRR
jgi:alanyl-tRNA synthetase